MTLNAVNKPTPQGAPIYVVEETDRFEKGQMLFVYGIFLEEGTRYRYKLYEEPRYATVQGYVTWGSHIATAYSVDDKDIILTGLVIDIPDDYDWAAIDRLEGGYNRVEITTEQGDKAFMYVGKDY